MGCIGEGVENLVFSFLLDRRNYNIHTWKGFGSGEWDYGTDNPGHKKQQRKHDSAFWQSEAKAWLHNGKNSMGIGVFGELGVLERWQRTLSSCVNGSHLLYICTHSSVHQPLCLVGSFCDVWLARWNIRLGREGVIG